MRGFLGWLAISVAALAQTIPPGVPLRVALEGRVVTKRVGEPIRGRLVESVYVYDRVALPAGCVVEGHVAKIGPVPIGRRLSALLSGNFTPPREVLAQFDAIVLGGGSQLSLRTAPARGAAHTMRVAKPARKGALSHSAAEGALRSPGETDRAAMLAFRAPGKLSQLKSRLFEMLPYRRQAWPAGTLFNSALQEPLTAPALAAVDYPMVAGAGAQEVRARLIAPISSATARRGAPVEAVVTRPVFSASRALLIPEGSLLHGEVVQAQPARRFHRNGKVLFVFRQVEPAAGAVQGVQGYLEQVEADFDAHVALDSEGAIRAGSPKTRFIFPAVAASVAGLSFHQDFNAQGIPDRDSGGRAESGAVGLGLIGTLVAQISRELASSIAIAGAGFGVYSTFIARGKDVVLPANTPLRISLGSREAAPALDRR
jgi:hypothetical protein